MAKIENPYTKILAEIDESLSLHKLEYTRISRLVVEKKLEENVKKYVNDPRVQEIHSQKKISEDDQGYLDINIFSSTYFKAKLDLSKEYEKEYKKFLDTVSEYKTLIENRITKFELNASLIAKFTKEELDKNPKISKMMSDAPEELENAKKKITRVDANLSRIYADFISKTGEDYGDKLYNFLFESKQFRKKFMNEKQGEIDSMKEVNKPSVSSTSNLKSLVSSQAEFNLLKERLLNDDRISNDELAEAKTYASKLFSAEQLAALNKFEEELLDEYAKLSTTDQIVKQRLAICLNQFNKGVEQVSDYIVESGGNDAVASVLEIKLNTELFEKNIDDTKHDPALINLYIGYAASLNKYIEEQNDTSKKGLFGKIKVDLGLEKLRLVHKNLCDFLKNRVGVDAELVSNNILGTMITSVKMQELAYSLMNNVNRISNTADIEDWQEGVNQLVVRCIFAMASSIEVNKDPIEDIKRYEEQYLTSRFMQEEVKEVENIKRAKRPIKTGDLNSVVRAILQ